MKNIQTTISPLLHILCLCGLGVFEYPRNQSRVYFTIFYILISWLSYAYIAYKTEMFLWRNELTFPIIIYTNLVFAILNMLSILYYNKKFKSCLDKLNIVNNTLEKLGTSKSYMKLRIQAIWLIIGWIALTLSIDINDYVWYNRHIPRSYAIIVVCIPCIANHSVHINTLNDFLYMMLIRYIGCQFEHINKHIQELAEKQSTRYARITSNLHNLNRRYMVDTETFKQNIWILMHTHLDLCSISHNLNTIFGLQMVMQAVAFHVFTVQIIYETYVNIKILRIYFTYENLIDFFNISLWIIVNIIKMIVLNNICEKTCIKANTAKILLNEITNLTFDVETHEIILQFLLQTLRRPFQISGLGLFYLGYQFLLQCMNFIAMIIIFVLQSPPRGMSYIGVELAKIV